MYDLTIIGAGWAGFNAALSAKRQGLKVCLLEESELGGTCLNRGCIPTKALIQSAKTFMLVKKAQGFGLAPLAPKIDFLKVQERKDSIVLKLRQGMQFMLKGIDFFIGRAEILSDKEIRVARQTIKTRFILIATGSTAIELDAFKFDGKKIVSSDDILNLREIPKTLLIVGGGVIGCEFAGLFSALGSAVSIVELMPQILPGLDKEAAKRLETTFKKKGIKVNTNTDVSLLDLKAYDLVLVCVGRKPKSEGLGLDRLGVNLEKGKVIVDDYLKTNIGNVFCAGDATAKTMLAHFAAYQGEIASHNIANPDSPKRADNCNIPNCIFTDPEIANVGLNEEGALNSEIDINVHRFDFLGSGMARILDETDGFIKIISDRKTAQVLGAVIIGPRATELISLLTLAVSCGLKVQQIRNTIFAHPTLSESLHETLK